MEQSEYIDYSSEEEQEYQQPKTDITDVEIFYKGSSSSRANPVS